jgi:hypothetical protein
MLRYNCQKEDAAKSMKDTSLVRQGLVPFSSG